MKTMQMQTIVARRISPARLANTFTCQELRWLTSSLEGLIDFPEARTFIYGGEPDLSEEEIKSALAYWETHKAKYIALIKRGVKMAELSDEWDGEDDN